MLVTSLVFLVIMMGLSINAIRATPETQYESMKGYGRFGELTQLINFSLNVAIFFAVFQLVPLFIHHFFIEKFPPLLFIILLVFTAMDIYSIGEGIRKRDRGDEEILDDYEEKADKFKTSKMNRVNYYASYAITNLLRLTIFLWVGYILYS